MAASRPAGSALLMATQSRDVNIRLTTRLRRSPDSKVSSRRSCDAPVKPTVVMGVRTNERIGPVMTASASLSLASSGEPRRNTSTLPAGGVDCVEPDTMPTDRHLALVPLTKTLGQPNRSRIRRVDQAHRPSPAKLIEGKVHRRPSPFVGKTAAPVRAAQCPADFGFRPALRVVKPCAAHEGAGG